MTLSRAIAMLCAMARRRLRSTSTSAPAAAGGCSAGADAGAPDACVLEAAPAGQSERPCTSSSVIRPAAAAAADCARARRRGCGPARARPDGARRAAPRHGIGVPAARYLRFRELVRSGRHVADHRAGIGTAACGLLRRALQRRAVGRELHQRRADLDAIAGLRMQRDDRAADRAREPRPRPWRSPPTAWAHRLRCGRRPGRASAAISASDRPSPRSGSLNTVIARLPSVRQRRANAVDDARDARECNHARAGTAA